MLWRYNTDRYKTKTWHSRIFHTNSRPYNNAPLSFVFLKFQNIAGRFQCKIFDKIKLRFVRSRSINIYGHNCKFIRYLCERIGYSFHPFILERQRAKEDKIGFDNTYLVCRTASSQEFCVPITSTVFPFTPM